MSMTWAQILSTIRTAVYGEEVREGIAQGMEKVKDFADQASAALPLDTTLSIPKKAADAKSVGDAIAAERDRATGEEQRIESLFTGPVENAVSDWLDDHPEATTTVLDQSITKAKLSTTLIDELKGKSMIDVRDFVSGTLTGSNLNSAIQNALEVGSTIYIPAGTYVDPLIVVQKSCTIVMDEECELQTTTAHPALEIYGTEENPVKCSIYGGKVSAGDADFGRYRTDRTDQTKRNYLYSGQTPYYDPDNNKWYSDHAIIELTGVSGATIEGLYCPYSKMSAVIQINGERRQAPDVNPPLSYTTVDVGGATYNCYIRDQSLDKTFTREAGVEHWRYGHPCKNVEIRNCRFENVLMSAIHVLYYNENIIIRGCAFKNSFAKYSDSYCYFVYTGAVQLFHFFVPPTGLIYEYNTCETSEDCALDTHGASNVVFRGNRMIDCPCSMTAYNDDSRVRRPRSWWGDSWKDWAMENILVENNYCWSQYDTTDRYSHALLFLGEGNAHRNQTYTTSSEHTYTNNPGSLNNFRNCIVRNNYLSRKNDCVPITATHTYPNRTYILSFNNGGRHIIVENNVIDGQGQQDVCAFQLGNLLDFKLINNQLVNAESFYRIRIYNSLGEISGNSGLPLFMPYQETISAYNTQRAFYYYGRNNNHRISDQNFVQSDYISMILHGSSYMLATPAKPFGIWLRDDLSNLQDDYVTPFSRSVIVSGYVATINDAYYDSLTGFSENHHSYNVKNPFVPGMNIKFDNGNGTTMMAYVKDVIDYSSFIWEPTSTEASIPDGTYTVSPRTTALVRLDNLTTVPTT